MEEFKNGVISEESLDEISGGVGVSKSTLKKVLIGTGVAVVSSAALVGAGFGIKKLHDKKIKSTIESPIESPIGLPMKPGNVPPMKAANDPSGQIPQFRGKVEEVGSRK